MCSRRSESCNRCEGGDGAKVLMVGRRVGSEADEAVAINELQRGSRLRSFAPDGAILVCDLGLETSHEVSEGSIHVRKHDLVAVLKSGEHETSYEPTSGTIMGTISMICCPRNGSSLCLKVALSAQTI